MNNPEIDHIVCATDAGREGELIFRYIYQMAGCNKPVDRLWISSLTFRAIKEGFENLKPDSEYDNLYKSARCRSEADWLIGMNGSRAYAIENKMRRLSVGRVLSPTLSILVERELERRNFIPEKYCEVVAKFDGYEGRMLNTIGTDPEKSTHFPYEQKATLEQFVENHSSTGRVIRVELEEELQPAQQLYDLTSLQRDANRLFGMSSKWTLDTAQRLYERHKAITYPRTDSRYLSTDIKSTLNKRLESLLSGELGSFARQALASEKDLHGRFILNRGVSDHHAIIPTGEAKGIENWTKQEKQIFGLIARRFIGMFFPNRDVIHQKMETAVDGRVFYSFGEDEVEAGWSAVDTSRNSNIQTLPDLSESDIVKVEKIRVRTDQTKPPIPHTEASLLTAMEHAGQIDSEDSSNVYEREFSIGTPATRAATIEKMIEKEMVVRKGRALIPTEYGIKLISILPEILQSPKMTGEWEAKLSRIGNGEYSAGAFMTSIRKLTKEVIDYAVQKGDTGINEVRSVGSCPLCGDQVREYDTAYYCVNKNCGFRRIYKAVKGFHPTLESKTMRELLANKSAVTEKGTYTLIQAPPYISFEYAPKQTPDYRVLCKLIDEYGLNPVHKVAYGGGLWLAGDKRDEMMSDFLMECKEIGCGFEFYADSKALHHKSGWCHRVASGDMAAYAEAFGIEIGSVIIDPHPEDSDKVLKMIQESGFEYADKRANGGSLWIIAGEEEAKALVARCKAEGTSFAFTPKGGRTSKYRPAWYSLSSKRS